MQPFQMGFFYFVACTYDSSMSFHGWRTHLFSFFCFFGHTMGQMGSDQELNPQRLHLKFKSYPVDSQEVPSELISSIK